MYSAAQQYCFLRKFTFSAPSCQPSVITCGLLTEGMTELKQASIQLTKKTPFNGWRYEKRRFG